MRFAVAALLVLASALPALADDPITIDVENFTADKGFSTLVLKVTNNTAKPIARAFIDCAFLDAQSRALDIGRAIATNIPPGGYAYEQAMIARSDGVQFAECRVSRYR